MRAAPKKRSADTGYSGKPLWRKLGLKAGLRVMLANAPDNYWTMCEFDPDLIELASVRARQVDFGHVFVRTKQQLKKLLAAAAKRLQPAGSLWISWPKKSAGVNTDLTENVLRDLALPLGLVDTKVCAVDSTWSGLKFVWRRDVRKPA